MSREWESEGQSGMAARALSFGAQRHVWITKLYSPDTMTGPTELALMLVTCNVQPNKSNVGKMLKRTARKKEKKRYTIKLSEPLCPSWHGTDHIFTRPAMYSTCDRAYKLDTNGLPQTIIMWRLYIGNSEN